VQVKKAQLQLYEDAYTRQHHLLVSMRARDIMNDTNFLKETIEFFIFTTPISLHINNFFIEFVLNIGLIIENINPYKFTKIINESYIG
jgi:hypothetical protein